MDNQDKKRGRKKADKPIVYKTFRILAEFEEECIKAVEKYKPKYHKD